MRRKNTTGQIAFKNHNTEPTKKEKPFDRDIMCVELDQLLTDLEQARNIICKTNHEFVFGFVFNSVTYSVQKLPGLYGKLEKILGVTQKDEKVVTDYKEMFSFLQVEYSSEKEEEGYNNDFLKKINQTIKMASRLRKNFT